MKNDLPPELSADEQERNAYNAAFYELGLHWHWDHRTWSALRVLSARPETRLRHYLEHEHPHLLQAYDADFLAAAIQQRQRAHAARGSVRPFDWAQAATGWQHCGA